MWWIWFVQNLILFIPLHSSIHVISHFTYLKSKIKTINKKFQDDSSSIDHHGSVFHYSKCDDNFYYNNRKLTITIHYVYYITNSQLQIVHSTNFCESIKIPTDSVSTKYVGDQIRDLVLVQQSVRYIFSAQVNDCNQKRFSLCKHFDYCPVHEVRKLLKQEKSIKTVTFWNKFGIGMFVGHR